MTKYPSCPLLVPSPFPTIFGRLVTESKNTNFFNSESHRADSDVSIPWDAQDPNQGTYEEFAFLYSGDG